MTASLAEKRAARDGISVGRVSVRLEYTPF